MSRSLAEVRLWGRTIGAVLMDREGGFASFEYAPAFSKSGIEVAPIMMPLGGDIHVFPGLPSTTFKGLPGMLADSLPDRFGNALIDSWLATQGRPPASLNSVERLCFMGRRGMGALEYEPVQGDVPDDGAALKVAELSRVASELMRQREEAAVRLPRGGDDGEAYRRLISVGSSAGGARAKAVVAWNPDSDDFRSGQADLPQGFEHWIIKLDEGGEAGGYGRIEHAYHRMARKAGVSMADCRLHLEGGRAHFMTRRFDREQGGGKVHMQTLGALAHYDFNSPRAHSYEQAFGVLRRLGLGADAAEELYRRMVFNVVARNQDDHVKNISFLMDKSGSWRLSPAYDLTHNMGVGPTASHQMTVNMKSDGFGLDDLRAVAKVAGLKRGLGDAILEQVTAAVRGWEGFATLDGVPESWARRVGANHRILID